MCSCVQLCAIVCVCVCVCVCVRQNACISFRIGGLHSDVTVCGLPVLCITFTTA